MWAVKLEAREQRRHSRLTPNLPLQLKKPADPERLHVDLFFYFFLGVWFCFVSDVVWRQTHRARQHELWKEGGRCVPHIINERQCVRACGRGQGDGGLNRRWLIVCRSSLAAASQAANSGSSVLGRSNTCEPISSYPACQHVEQLAKVRP